MNFDGLRVREKPKLFFHKNETAKGNGEPPLTTIEADRDPSLALGITEKAYSYLSATTGSSRAALTAG